MVGAGKSGWSPSRWVPRTGALAGAQISPGPRRWQERDRPRSKRNVSAGHGGTLRPSSPVNRLQWPARACDRKSDCVGEALASHKRGLPAPGTEPRHAASLRRPQTRKSKDCPVPSLARPPENTAPERRSNWSAIGLRTFGEGRCADSGQRAFGLSFRHPSLPAPAATPAASNSGFPRHRSNHGEAPVITRFSPPAR